jgi:ribosomal protein S18 acetylase RimI-like enzyme
LTENYNIDFYLQYLIQWPSLFTVVEDQYGNIAGYSERGPVLFGVYFPCLFLWWPVLH